MYIFEGFITTWGFNSLKDVLEILMVPIAVALIALLGTQRWQNRQRDLQTKTELVTKITEVVMKTMMTVELISTNQIQQGDSDDREQELNRIYKNWKVETCVIGSKLHAYFPESKRNGHEALHLKWRLFSDDLSNYYKGRWKQEGQKSASCWDEDKDALFDEKTRIIAEILTSKITGFRNKSRPPE